MQTLSQYFIVGHIHDEMILECPKDTKLEEICQSYEGVEKSYAVQAGREIRIMVQPEVINDEKMVLVARQIAQQIEDEMEYPGQIKVNIIRESRAVEYAK